MQKQDIPINFAQGLDTKTDPWQVAAGKFLSLENSVFTKAGLLQKRNGYETLTTLPVSAAYITTLNGGLNALSNEQILTYNRANETWVDRGVYSAITVSTQPAVRNSVNQTQCDTAIAPNGLICTAYTETVNASNTYWFTIADSTTGQTVVPPTPLSGAGSPRVFLLGNFFVIVFTAHPSTYLLEYFAIPVAKLYDDSGNVNITSAQVTSTAVIPATTQAWDGAVAAGRLFIAFNSTSGGQSVKVTYLTPQNVSAGQSGVTPVSFTDASFIGDVVSVCGDITTPTNPQVYVSFIDTAAHNAYIAGLDYNLAPTSAPTLIRAGGSGVYWADLTSVAQNGRCTVFGEVTHAYGYDGSIPSNYVETVAVAPDGTILESVREVVRSVGLASKAFLHNGVAYFLAAYQSPFQPSYFLVNGFASAPSNPQIIAKLAYENGGGYLATGLPSVTVLGQRVIVAYLFKDLIESLNTLQNSKQTTAGGIYSQTGVNVATFLFGSKTDSAEIAGSLHLGGGFLWQYDGHSAVEHNFFLWPDSVEATWSATGGSIHAQPDGATNTNAYYYQAVYEWTDNAGNIHKSAPSIPVAVTTTSNGTTGSITVNVPTLRLTYKTATPVSIVLYRWSVANQVYYQVTSTTAPVQNDTTVDYRTFVDTHADASIIGNSIIYTLGGVVEDVNAPATSIVSLFDTRLWMVDDEDRNLLWFSKQVIEATPVEMSDLFTFYIAPTSGSQGSTGPMAALAPLDDKLVIFKESAIYYINGTGPDNTGANNQYSQPIFVTSTVGCANQQSIVFMPNGLMFQSDKGIWLLDRSMNTTYIGAPVEGFTQGAVVKSALNIPGTNQVRFTLDTGITLMYDYFFGQWGTFVNVPAVSSCIYQGMHTYLSASGQISQETVGTYTDNGEPTLMAFTTSWFNFASLQGFERAYYFYLLGQYYSPHLLNVGISYDYVPGPVHTSLIRPDNFSSAVPSPFGDQPAPFGSPSALEQWRVNFKYQKCQSFQINVQEIYDPSLGVPAGAGFTLSGLSLKVAAKRGTRPLAARKSVG